MAHDTMRRNGGWTVELVQPVKHKGTEINEISFRPPTFDHTLRWAQGRIISVMGLMSELSGLPEVVFKNLTYPDADRVMFAFTYMLPASIRDEIPKGQHPIDTPQDAMTDEQRFEEAESDEADPRFPKADGPVKRFPAPLTPEIMPEDKPEPAQQESSAGFDMQNPTAAKRTA